MIKMMVFNLFSQLVVKCFFFNQKLVFTICRYLTPRLSLSTFRLEPTLEAVLEPVGPEQPEPVPFDPFGQALGTFRCSFCNPNVLDMLRADEGTFKNALPQFASFCSSPSRECHKKAEGSAQMCLFQGSHTPCQFTWRVSADCFEILESTKDGEATRVVALSNSFSAKE